MVRARRIRPPRLSPFPTVARPVMILTMQLGGHSLREAHSLRATWRRALPWLCCLTAALGHSTSTLAQEPPAPLGTPVIAPETRAADDAFQNLVDKVLTLRLEDDLTTLAEFLVLLPATNATSTDASARTEHDLRQALLAECQQGAPRRTTGGGIELDVMLSPARIEEILKTLAIARLPKEMHARVALHASSGPVVTATGRYIPDGRPRDARPGWRHCAPDQIAQTRTAVHSDVHRRLFDLVAGLRLTGGERLRAVMAQSAAFRAALLRRVDAVPLGEPTFDRVGVCRLALNLSADQLRELVQAAIADAQADLPAELAQAITLADVGNVAIEGFAVPPPQVSPPARTQRLAEPGRPDWVARVLNVRATGAAPTGVTDPQLRRELALKTARMEAARLLWLDLERLPLPTGTLGDRLAAHPRMAEAIASIDALLVPTSSPVYDEAGRVTITLGVRLEPVWQIVRNLK